MSQPIQRGPDQQGNVKDKAFLAITEDAPCLSFADLVVDGALTPVEVKVVEVGDRRTARPEKVLLTELQCEV